MKLATLKFIGTFNYSWQLKILVLSRGDFSIKGRNIFSGCGLILPWLCLDLGFTLPWHYLDLALSFHWTCFDLALTLPRPCLDFASTLPRPCLDLALTLPRPCLDLASTSPWTWLDLANLPLKFGQNQVSNSCFISNMAKCHPDKCCLDECCLHKSHCNGFNLFYMFPGTYDYSFIKIGSVTAEILLTLTGSQNVSTAVPVVLRRVSVQ